MCTVQTFGNRKIINLGTIDNKYKMIICDNETHNTIKMLLSFKKEIHLPHTSLCSNSNLAS